jgi:hypothetical protein
MKKIVVVLLATAIAPFAYAQSAAPAAPAESKDAASAPAAVGQSALTAQASPEAARVKALLGERNCLRETGSRIVRKDGCVNATGRSYGQTAIERTGTYDPGLALERLDPAIRITP